LTKIFLNVILFLLLFIKIQNKLRKKFKIQKYIFSSQPHLSIKTDSTGSIQVKPCRPGKKWVFSPFRVKTIIFDQNRVHRVNTGQTMSTRVKNEFLVRFRSKLLFLVKTVIFGQNPVHRVDTHRNYFLVFQHNFRSLKLILGGWIGLFLILIWVLVLPI